MTEQEFCDQQNARAGEFHGWLSAQPDLKLPDGIVWPRMTPWPHIVDPKDSGYYHHVHYDLTVLSSASEERALEGACKALETMAHGQLAGIRQKPSVRKDTDFASGKVTYVGHVRFYVTPEEGDWLWQDDHPGQVRYVGFGGNE